MKGFKSSLDSYILAISSRNFYKTHVKLFCVHKCLISATEHRVYTVINESILVTNDPDLWSYSARSAANPQTGLPFMEGTNPTKPFLRTSINLFLCLSRGFIHAFKISRLFNVDQINGLHSLRLRICHLLHSHRCVRSHQRRQVQRSQQNHRSLKDSKIPPKIFAFHSTSITSIFFAS